MLRTAFISPNYDDSLRKMLTCYGNNTYIHMYLHFMYYVHKNGKVEIQMGKVRKNKQRILLIYIWCMDSLYDRLNENIIIENILEFTAIHTSLTTLDICTAFVLYLFLFFFFRFPINFIPFGLIANFY